MKKLASPGSGLIGSGIVKVAAQAGGGFCDYSEPKNPKPIELRKQANARRRKRMAYENILYEEREGIGWITFNRPKVLNALNERTIAELDDALAKVREDSEVRALILTGAGDKAFIAGADIGELARCAPVDGRETSLRGQTVLRRLETLGKVSIAAINGFALGGGCEVALACTIRLASRAARIGQPEVKLGLLPGYGGTQRLARLCGKGIAHELCLTGEMISAEEALRIGLVNHVYEPAELLPAAEALAKKIIANAPLAVRYAMEAIERGLEMPQAEAFQLEAALFGISTATQDFREGTRAFLEKRPAKFQGK
ncbi:MAG TPA: enoyl-CoA hydratase-related protein [Methylomirabilota bacterium]|nr:enoyl-CoA hydratase-related protein [Methylomirabilota bacterium]